MIAVETEKRIYKALELRADDGSKGKVIEGHAVVFNQPAVIGDSFIERISPEAFAGCDLSDVALFVNHDTSNLPLARTQSGTLTLTVDNVGLAIRAILDAENNPDAKALWHSIARGDLRSMSFAFTVADNGDEWQNLNSDMPTRIIHNFKKIYEVSCVSFPAYPQTDLQARARQMITNVRKEKNRMTNYDRELLLKYGFDPNEKNDDERMRNLMTARCHEADCVNEERARARYNAEAPFGGFATEQDLTNFIISSQGGIAPYPKSQRQRDLDSRFIPIHEGSRMNSAIVTRRVQAGQDLKERCEVVSEFNAFGERRTITLGTQDGVSASLIAPQYSSEKITEKFPVVSSLVEAVAHLSLNGGESFSQPYVTDIAEGGYTKEGEDAVEAETQFDYAPINRVKITAYAELTEELERLPNAAYADVVFQHIRSSILKVLSREILFGEGVDDVQSRLVGIFSPKANAINSNTDLEMSAITDQTLNEILYRYGGDEQVESPSCLILNKLDLLAFANVRTSTKQNFYDIQYSGNGASGTINGVRFIVDSACKPLISSDTQSGDYCMCYGNLANYLLCEFSHLTVKRSDDYRFRKGITCFRGSVICGGNVVKSNGFIRVKKK